jgi:hypothetical protein
MINVNGTIAKKLHKGNDGASYKLANQALYPVHERHEAIEQLELCRVSKHRIRLYTASGKQTGYIRHVEIEGEKFPKLFAYKNSKTGQSIAFPISRIEFSNAYYQPHVLFERNKS